VDRRKLLLIDDSELTLRVTASVLESAGYEVRTSTDVTNLRGLLGDWAPDVILTDVNMPDISGVELCRKLKASYDTAHVPVVLFSSLSNAQLEVLARECEADGFLSKSLVEELPEAVAALIQSTLF
jgi:CheY-like chemotaxis protein